jgi:disulfide bond formation protein DsbB
MLVRWRLGFLALTLICGSAIGYALYLQYEEFLSPCPLCIFQRIGIITFGAVSLLAALFPLRRATWFWPALLTLVGLGGASVSARQVYLQYFLTDKSSLGSCGPGLQYMLDNQPWLQVFRSVLVGHGECAVIDWKFFGLSLPCWTLVLFLALIAAAWLIRAWQGGRK